jgi:serine/threonine protein kinase
MQCQPSHITTDSRAALLLEEQQQQQQQADEMEGEVEQNKLTSSCWDMSRACNQKPLSPLAAASRVLLPEQTVTFTLLTKGEGGYRKSQEQQLQLKVVGLLGEGGTNEVHEVQQLLPAVDAADTVNAAGVYDVTGLAAATAGSADNSSDCGGNTGDSSCTVPKHLALKVLLRWSCVSPDSQRTFFGEYDFYMWSRKQLEREHDLLTQLAGQPGITRCYGYKLVSFTTPNSVNVTALGLLLELAELGDLRQQLVPEPGVFAAMSASEAWSVMRDMVEALSCVHNIAKHVYEDLKPANICCSRASGRVRYKLVDFASCREVEENGETRPRAVNGTPGFMAPEAAAGAAHSYSADTWSLGESQQQSSSRTVLPATVSACPIG